MAHSGSANINPLGRWSVSDIHEARCSSLTEQHPHCYLLLYLLQYNYPHWHSSLVQAAFKGNGRQDSLSHAAQRLPCSVECVCVKEDMTARAPTVHAPIHCPHGVGYGVMACNGDSFPHQSLKCSTTKLLPGDAHLCVCTCGLCGWGGDGIFLSGNSV